MLECQDGNDLLNPESWRIADESNLHRVEAVPGDTFACGRFSLDMTYFTTNGKHYVVWAEKPGPLSNLYIAQINPDQPWKMISPCVLLTSADFGNQQFGTGHNSFTVDEYGNPVIVYHARPLSCTAAGGNCGYDGGLGDPCRHARAKSLNFAYDGTPILNMTAEEELSAENSTVKITVIVSAAAPVDKTALQALYDANKEIIRSTAGRHSRMRWPPQRPSWITLA